MSEQAHTRGPWSAEPCGDMIIGPEGQAVANTWLGEGFGPDTESANARLIAAAPELLDALKERVEAHFGDWPLANRVTFCRDYPDHPITRWVFLIAKATGQ